MVADLIINIVYAFVLLILSVFSVFGEVSISSEFLTAIESIGGFLKAVDNFLPVSTILAILAIELVIESAIFGYKLIKWSYSKVPGIN